MRSAVLVVVDLRAGAFQIAVMVEQLQSSQKLLCTAWDKRDDMRRPQKAMSVNQPDDLAITLGQLDGFGLGSTFESGKTGKHHLSTLPGGGIGAAAVTSCALGQLCRLV